MKIECMKQLFIRILLFSLLALIFSCTTSSPKNRGSLSEAMDKSRDDYEEEREVPDERDTPRREEEKWDDDDDDDDSYYSRPSSDNEPQEELRLLVRGGQGFVNDPYFDSVLDGELLLGTGVNFSEFYGFVGFKTLKTQSDHSVSLSIKPDSFMLHAGLEGRFYPLPKMSFLSPYFLGRVGGIFYFWSFTNPLIAGDDTISSDTVGGALLGVGAGVDLIHTKMFRLGAQVTPEVYLFGEETSQGFTNDYFNAQGTVKWSVEGGWQF